MTGNMIKGKGFRGALRYNLEKVDKGVAEVLDHSFVEVSEKTIMKEIQMIKVMRPNLQKFFYHTSINFPPAEDLSNERMKQIGQEYLKESGFTQHQYIMFRHRDADHPHLHILVNRIGYDGKVFSDSNDFAKCEKILRDLEKKYKLTEVISSKQAKERAMTKDELEMIKRTNMPSHKMCVQALIKDTLASKPKLTCSEFIHLLESKGVNVLFNQASTGYVSGISYSYEGMTFTGSKLGNDFKWTTIKNSIDYEQDRDRATIHQTNARTLGLGKLSKELSTTQGSRKNIQKLKQGTLKFAPSSSRSRKSNDRSKSKTLTQPVAQSLADLLDRGISGLLSSPSHDTNSNPGTVPSIEDEFKKKKKKKRRGLRM
jgi:Relaxase/Mobilisation nuclease domain